MKQSLLLFGIMGVLSLHSCKKEETTSCTLRILKSPTGQNQSIFANIDVNENNYTVINPQALLADGGTPLRNYTWSIESSPTPPSGYIFWPLTGVIDRTGTTPNGLTVGTRKFKVKVSDGSCSKSEYIDLIITDDPLSPTAVLQQLSGSFTLKSADAGKAYGASLYALGGVPPYHWHLDETYAGSADLTNAGLQVEEAAGIVRGTVLSSALGKTIKFKVVLTDSKGDKALVGTTYTIVVN